MEKQLGEACGLKTEAQKLKPTPITGSEVSVYLKLALLSNSGLGIGISRSADLSHSHR